MKLCINGYAQHGKDTIADKFALENDLIKANASMLVAQDIVVLAPFGVQYDDAETAYADRVNYRSEWYEFIRWQCREDPTYYVKKCLERGGFYVGHRNREEYEASIPLFDATIWVDASSRGLPKEDPSSCDMDPTGHDYVLDNGDDPKYVWNQVIWISRLINNKKEALNAYL